MKIQWNDVEEVPQVIHPNVSELTVEVVDRNGKRLKIVSTAASYPNAGTGPGRLTIYADTEAPVEKVIN